MTTDATFQMVPLIDLVPSTRNHRKHFDAQKMTELVASIKEKGVLQPVLVRPVVGMPNGTKYELVAGERRYRASKAAGLEVIPAVVRQMTDEAVLECQAIENGQREDVHPLEEAAGYHDLIRIGKRDAKWIAARIGKSEKYVYDRIKLLALTKEAQQLFWDGEIEAGHAILLARLTPALQKQVIEDDRDGLFDEAFLSFTPEEDEGLDDKTKDRLTRKARTVRELQDYINDHFRFEPSQADPFLYPETTETVKLAAGQRVKVVHITHDLHIQEEARDPKTRTIVPSSWQRADGQHGSKTCAHAVIGVVVCGPGRGESFRVCLAKEKCATHWGQWQKARAKRQHALAKGGAHADQWKDQQQKQEERRLAQEEREELERKRWQQALPDILAVLAAAVSKAPTKATSFLGSVIIDRLSDSWRATSKKAEPYVARGRSADDLIRHAAFLILMQEAASYHGLEALPKLAKHLQVDVKKILEEVAVLPKAETAAKKKHGKKKKAA